MRQLPKLLLCLFVLSSSSAFFNVFLWKKTHIVNVERCFSLFFSKSKVYLHYFGCCLLQRHSIVKSSFFEKDTHWMLTLISCRLVKWLNVTFFLLNLYSFFSIVLMTIFLCFFEKDTHWMLTLISCRLVKWLNVVGRMLLLIVV